MNNTGFEAWMCEHCFSYCMAHISFIQSQRNERIFDYEGDSRVKPQVLTDMGCGSYRLRIGTSVDLQIP